jgi:hypothetical protein
MHRHLQSTLTLFSSSHCLWEVSHRKIGDVRENHILFCLLVEDWFFLVVSSGGACAEAIVVFGPISSSLMPLGSFSQPPA